MIKKILCRLSVSIGGIFFERKYLKGEYFKGSSKGAKWVWRSIFHQVIGGENKAIPWPVSHFNTIIGPYENIIFDPDNIDNFQGKGVYFQCEKAKIYIGKGTLIANNVGIITANHDLVDIREHSEGKDVVIGEDCWIGINSVILPGVVLGRHTIVGAGSVVTHSFPEGNSVIAGDPAKEIKKLEGD